METFVKGRNLSNDEKRIKLSETLNKAHLFRIDW